MTTKTDIELIKNSLASYMGDQNAINKMNDARIDELIDDLNLVKSTLIAVLTVGILCGMTLAFFVLRDFV